MSARSLNSFTHSFDIGQVEGGLVLCFGERGLGCFLREQSITCVGSKPPKDNLSSRQRKAIRDLRRDKEIVVLPADKGNVTVVMDQSDYTVKMEALLEDSAYRRLKYDPTTKVEARIASALKEL